MAYSSLKRKTPLKAKTPLRPKGGFKPRQPLNGEPRALLPKKAGESPSERAKTARKSARSSLETHLDIVFSQFIRLRDAMDGGLTRCISCGRVFPFSQMQCGHYISRANRALRWDERNANAECIHCNCFDASHLVGYRKNLVRKIGEGEVADIERSSSLMKKFSKDELKEKIDYYKRQAVLLSKEKGIPVKVK